MQVQLVELLLGDVQATSPSREYFSLSFDHLAGYDVRGNGADEAHGQGVHDQEVIENVLVHTLTSTGNELTDDREQALAHEHHEEQLYEHASPLVRIGLVFLSPAHKLHQPPQYGVRNEEKQRGK